MTPEQLRRAISWSVGKWVETEARQQAQAEALAALVGVMTEPAEQREFFDRVRQRERELHGELLERIEDSDPELAALIDSRGPDDMPQNLR